MNIDYVVPYVDCDDPAWIQLYNEFKECNQHTSKENKLRFAQNRMFRYVFRGIERFMPWINNVILLVQSESQVPKWLNTQKVRVVTHDQFIPHEFLPTFNSCTIECFLHMIPGLSPFFIYGNDDTYIFNDIKPSDFFSDVMPLGTIRKHHVSKLNPDFHSLMCRRMTETVCDKLQTQITDESLYYTPYHIQSAFSKSIYTLTYKLFEKEINQSISKFREVRNISQYLFQNYYMLSTNKKYFSNVTNKRLDIITQFNDIKNILSSKTKPQLLCLNNNDQEKDIQLLCLFNKVFPDKCKYEI